MGTVEEEINNLREWKHDITDTVNTIKVKEELMEIKIEKLEDMPKEIAVMTARIDVWMKNTEEYRKELSGNIVSIFTLLNALPCEARAEASRNEKLLRNLMWTAIGIVFGILAAHIGWK